MVLQGAIYAAIYCRISKDAERRGDGVARQERECRRLARELGWRIGAVLIDNDISAVASRRPGWSELLAGLRSRRYGAVVAVHPDRLSRSLRALADLIEIVQTTGAQVATVRAGTLDLSTAAGRLQHSIIGVVAAAERENMSERIKARLASRAEDGLPHGRASYGWSRVDRLRADPDEAAVVRELARRVLACESLRALAGDLNRRGVRPPTGESWTSTKVRNVLRRPANAGDLVRHGRVVGVGAQEPILDRDTYDRVEALLSDPARRTTGNPARRHLLSGVARCGVCQGPIWTRRLRGAWKYWCQRNHVTRSEADVDQYVTDVALGVLRRPDARDLWCQQDELMDAAALRAEELALRDRLNSLAEAHAGGDIDREQLRAGSRKLHAALAQVTEQLKATVRVNPLASLVGDDDISERWHGLSLAVRGQIIAELVTVVINPTRQGARTFDPSTVVVAPRGAA
jgi:DNA invertase Pin-like site-specific DNA recombinase